MKAPEEENRKLEKLSAEMMLDVAIPARGYGTKLLAQVRELCLREEELSAASRLRADRPEPMTTMLAKFAMILLTLYRPLPQWRAHE